MKFTEKISLETVGDKQFRIKLIEPENNQEAVLTHYLHSLKSKKIAKFFKDDAINFTKEILEHHRITEKLNNFVQWIHSRVCFVVREYAEITAQ
mgnify:CR=1 FL=1